MGTAFFVTLEREIPNLDAFMNGKPLARESDQLDRMAATLGVRPLMEFFSADPEMAEEFLDDEIDVPPRTWSPADEGLKTVNALHGYLLAHPSAVADQEQVLADPTDMQRVLSGAAEQRVGWCLNIDI